MDRDKISAGQPDDDEDVEQLESDAPNHEQVRGGDLRRVVAKEGKPSLRRGGGSLSHVVEHDSRPYLAARSRRREAHFFPVCDIEKLTEHPTSNRGVEASPLIVSSAVVRPTRAFVSVRNRDWLRRLGLPGEPRSLFCRTSAKKIRDG